MTNDLRAARLEANLTLKEVAKVLGRSFEWLRQIEVGQRAVKSEIESQIREVVSTLKHMKEAQRSQRGKLKSSFALPQVAARPRAELNT